MARNKLRLEFDGLTDYVERLERIGKDVGTVATKALEESFDVVTPGLEKAVDSSKFNFDRTGRTEESLQTKPKIEKNGNRYSIGVGFDIKNGGLASIFLMYGTPTITPDRKLYNAIFGKKVRDKVADVQREVFAREVGDR